jgi:hypothetical protein
MILVRTSSASLIIAISQVKTVVPVEGMSPPAMESGPFAVIVFQKLMASILSEYRTILSCF